MRALVCAVVLFSQLLGVARAQLSPQIPSVAEFTASGSGGSFPITSDLQILVDENFAIELTDYAATFRKDLIWITNFTDLPIVTVAPDAEGEDQPTVFLTIGDSDHTLYNGDSTLEGYNFEITFGGTTAARCCCLNSCTRSLPIPVVKKSLKLVKARTSIFLWES